MQNLNPITAKFSVSTFNFWTCLSLIFFSTYNTYSQENFKDIEFKSLSKRIIWEGKKNLFSNLDSIFERHAEDTVKMKYLAEHSKKKGFAEGEAYALEQLGNHYKNNGNYKKAIDFFLQANIRSKHTNNKQLRANILMNLGVCYHKLDLIQNSIDYLKQALDIAESVQKQPEHLKHLIATCQNNLGTLYIKLKQFDLALELFKEALVTARELNDKNFLATCYHNIGIYLEEKGLYNEALKNYKTSLSFNNEIDCENGKSILYNSLGRIHILMEEPEKALEYIIIAQRMSIELNNEHLTTKTYINLGQAYTKINKYSLAKSNLMQGLKIAERLGKKDLLSKCYLRLSELYELNHNSQKALSFYKKHIDLENTITNERDQQYLTDLIVKHESQKKNNQIKALASENEIVKLKLEQNKKTLILGVCGLILAACVLLILYRQRQLHSDKKILRLEQDMLRNQMNPHFIFNSLNSIKLYIINNERENAVYYLNKFSKLIRKILLSSKEKDISLEDELDTMALYMNIENIRFSNEIKYQVHISPEVNPSSIRVPSMILQPFLENALWHGLSSKKGIKKISLRVEKLKPEFVTITIIDNGVGRKASESIQKQKTLNRKSVGIAITQERLTNFSKRYSNMYHLKIEDLYNIDNSPAGTKVVINIPINASALRTA